MAETEEFWRRALKHPTFSICKGCLLVKMVERLVLTKGKPANPEEEEAFRIIMEGVEKKGT